MTKATTTPSPHHELLHQWLAEIWHEGTPVRIAASDLHIAAKSSQWGYEQRGAANEAELQKARDEELDACCEYLTKYASWEPEDVQEMRDARRPKPLSMIDQSIALIDKIQSRKGMWQIDDLDIVLCCLKRLQELEGQADD